jgi:hypothetical protein
MCALIRGFVYEVKANRKRPFVDRAFGKETENKIKNSVFREGWALENGGTPGEKFDADNMILECLGTFRSGPQKQEKKKRVHSNGNSLTNSFFLCFLQMLRK